MIPVANVAARTTRSRKSPAGRDALVAGSTPFVGDDGFVESVLGDDWSYLFAIDT